MPLFHTKVLLPRARAGKSMLAEQIRDLGGEVTMYPNIQVLDVVPTKTKEELSEVSGLLFTSKEAVERFFDYLAQLDLDIRSLKTPILLLLASKRKKLLVKRNYSR